MDKPLNLSLLAASALAAMIFLSGCNLLPGGSEIAKLGNEIKESQQKSALADQAATGAMKVAEEARKLALEANQKADKSLAEAIEMRKAIADLNEKMDRMFKKTMMK